MRHAIKCMQGEVNINCLPIVQDQQRGAINLAGIPTLFVRQFLILAKVPCPWDNSQYR